VVKRRAIHFCDAGLQECLCFGCKYYKVGRRVERARKCGKKTCPLVGGQVFDCMKN
jgi:hypothetical protein